MASLVALATVCPLPKTWEHERACENGIFASIAEVVELMSFWWLVWWLWLRCAPYEKSWEHERAWTIGIFASIVELVELMSFWWPDGIGQGDER